jgi:hypothetical protein
MIFRHLAGAALAVAMAAAPGPAESVAVQLQKGIYAQQTAGDLDGAIRIFRQIIASNPAQTVYAAQAQVHLAQALLQQSGVAAPARESATATDADLSEDSVDLAGADVRSFRVQLRGLFDQAAYSELDLLAAQLRSQKARFKGGAWKLHAFYTTVGSPGSLTATDAEWQSRIAKLQQWIQDSPASPTPRIALAHAYIHFAWKARGNGGGNTVTAQGWALFNQRVKAARAALEDAVKSSGRDPEWYLQMQTVALAQGWDRTQVDALAAQALADEPSYYYFAVAQANWLLPKWYGKPGETEQYAEQVANQAGGTEGDSAYYEMAAALNCCRKTQAPALSWTRVRQGFAALDQAYGSTNGQRNAMAYLALRAGDAETAQRMFARIGNDWVKRVWETKAVFDASRTGKPVGGAKPVRPDGAARVSATPSN